MNFAPADKGVFGSLLSESSVAQIYQLMEFLTRREWTRNQNQIRPRPPAERL